jgi:hypothetical protein
VVPVPLAASIAAYFPAGIPAEKDNMRQSCLSGFKPDQSPDMRLWGCNPIIASKMITCSFHGFINRIHRSIFY